MEKKGYKFFKGEKSASIFKSTVDIIFHDIQLIINKKKDKIILENLTTDRGRPFKLGSFSEHP